MKTANELMSDGVESIKLSILVFGPQVEHMSEDERTNKLQHKRIEIRKKLEDIGHHVKYAEDIVDPNLPGPGSNSMLQELVIMSEYDLIITLVGSPGSIAETSVISVKPDLAMKSSLFLDEEYNDGLVAESCRLAEMQGADFNTYSYPKDLDECNLLGFIRTRVSNTQVVKFLS